MAQTITLELPDELARAAAAAGLLTSEALVQLLSAELGRQRRPSTLSRARGLLKGAGASPSDDMIGRWREERRTERYG